MFANRNRSEIGLMAYSGYRQLRLGLRDLSRDHSWNRNPDAHVAEARCLHDDCLRDIQHGPGSPLVDPDSQNQRELSGGVDAAAVCCPGPHAGPVRVLRLH